MQTTLPAGDGIRWPEGRQIAVLLTFDFDADRLQSAYFRQEDLPFADRSRGLYGPDEGLPRILSMLSRQNVPATFFVPGVICRRCPEQVRAIAAAGHEIAAHGDAHDSHGALLSPEEARLDMERAEASIAAITGKKPVGCRLPGGYQQSHTVDLLLERGYRYSSAVNPAKCCDWAYCYQRQGKKQPLVEFSTDPMLEDLPYYFFTFVPPHHKASYNNAVVREIWQDEFDGRRQEGDKFLCLKLHPALIGRASRCKMLEELIVYMKENGAWFASCETAADYVIAQNSLTGEGDAP